MPTFNRAHALGRTLESLLQQTFTDFELVVVDDASSDETPEVVRRFDDPRIRYHRNPVNLGLYPAWNRCLDLARGEYVTVYHDHDVYDPRIVDRCVAVLATHPEVSFVYTAVRTIDSAGQHVRTWAEEWWPAVAPGRRVARRMARRWSSFIQASTVMARRDAYALVGKYPENLGLPADMDMWVRLALVGDVGYIREPVVATPARQAGDYTFQARWVDVQALARIQRTNWSRAYAGHPLMLIAGHIWCPVRRDAGYLLFLARAVAKDDGELVGQSAPILATECLRVTRVLAWLLRMTPFVARALRALLPAYRSWKKVRWALIRRAFWATFSRGATLR
ncbi:MAG: glycosyltransferase family 2 protein [Candidatus Rokubacteria bacterium]|nr:glycosyltransferase family 2 protein [Candidatus Rokubacteria bacterium]